jgi:hypothetical protein
VISLYGWLKKKWELSEKVLSVFKSLKPPLTLKARCRPFISLKVDLNGEHNLNYMTSDISLG